MDFLNLFKRTLTWNFRQLLLQVLPASLDVIY